MKDKHLVNPSDTALLKFILREVDEKLVLDPKTFKIKIWFKFVFYISITILFYSLLYHIESAFLFVLCYIAYGFSILLFAFNFSHDCAHNTVFKSKTVNNLVYSAIYTLVGAHAEAWKQRHIQSHHYAPNVEAYDSDLKITNLIRIIPDSQYKWYHKYQHIYASFAYTSYSLFWIFIKDIKILYSKDEFNENKNLGYHLSFWIQKFIYLSVAFFLPLLFSNQELRIVILGFIAMHLSQSIFLLFTFFMTHHVLNLEYPTTDENGFINTSWLMNQIKSSNDMHPFSEIANFILGGFNNHIAHHLFPHIHHIYYPKLNKILYATLRNNNIEPNQTTYWGGIVSHLKLLKQMSVK